MRLKPGLRRAMIAVARLPARLDRPGWRWLLSGRVMPGGAVVIIEHRGRRSGKLHLTPVEALAENREVGEIFVSPAGGKSSNWYRNIVAGGLVRVRVRGHAFTPDWAILRADESKQVLVKYRDDHRLWGGLIIRALARQHGLSGDPLDAVAASLPMLVLRAPADGPSSSG